MGWLGYKHPSISIVSLGRRAPAALCLSYLALTAHFFVQKRIAQHQSAQRMSSGQICLYRLAFLPHPGHGVQGAPSPSDLSRTTVPGNPFGWLAHHCPALVRPLTTLLIYPSRRGDLPCTGSIGTFPKLSEVPTGLWKRIFWETSQPEPGANGQPDGQGDQQCRKASSTADSIFPFPLLGAAACCGGEDTGRGCVIPHRSGFWVLDLRGSPNALSSRKTSQIPPCTSCLRKKAARSLARHPLDHCLFST